MQIEFSIETNGEEQLFRADIEGGNMVDEGIGPYEFWGSRGRHSHMVFRNYEIENLMLDEGDRLIPFELNELIEETIHQKLNKL